MVGAMRGTEGAIERSGLDSEDDPDSCEQVKLG